MTCFYCGTELPAGAMFCGECGRPVNTKGGRSSRRAAAAARASIPVDPPRPEEPPVAVAPAGPEPVHAAPAEPEPVHAAPAEPEPAETVAAEVAVDADPVALEEPPAAPVFGAHQAYEIPFSIDPEPAPLEAPPPAPAPEPPLMPAWTHTPMPAPEPAPVSEPAPTPDIDLAVSTERCAQCGAPLTAADIFCPECGFVRQRVSAPARPSDTNILDPFPWGLPRATPPAPPAPPAQHTPLTFEPDLPPAPPYDGPAMPFADITDVSETRLVPRGPRGDRFVLQFSTGESVSVSGSGLIGRNPVAEPGEYFDTLVAIVDPGRSVSKTHLEFGQDETSFWVSDRYSGNGTVMREPDREPRRCDAGKRYRVVRGTRVEIGEQFFIVS